MKTTEENQLAKLNALLREMTDELRMVRKAMIENIGITRRLLAEKDTLLRAVGHVAVKGEERVQQARAPTLTEAVAPPTHYRQAGDFDGAGGRCLNCGQPFSAHVSGPEGYSLHCPAPTSVKHWSQR